MTSLVHKAQVYVLYVLDFGVVWDDDARAVKISTFWNQQRQRLPFWKIEDMPYLSNGLIDLHKVGQDGAKWITCHHCR